MVTPYPRPTSKLVAEIDFNLKSAFMRKVESRGQTQKYILEKLIKAYLLEDENIPKGFPRKRSTEVTTSRRVEL